MAALSGGNYCYTHEPTNARARAQAHKLGGQRTKSDHGGDLATIPAQARSLADVMGLLDYVLAELLPLENSIARARVLISLVAGYIDAIKVGEMEARITALENKR